MPEDALIVGAGFGWGVEAFITHTGVTNTIGIDVSAYIHAEKDNSEEAELRQAVTDAGLDPDSGRGAWIIQQLLDMRGPGARCKTIVLDEDAQTNTSRQAIKSALGAWPSVCITEMLIDEDTTAQEITQVDNALHLFAGSQRVIHIVSSLVNWTPQQVKDLVPDSEVITPSGEVHLV